MWDMFKAFLRQSLGDSQAFVDAYWGKIKRDFQYQLEEVFDWAAHLEHLQAVSQRFDPIATPNKKIMIRWLLEGLKPSVRAQLDVWGQHQDSSKEAVKKAVNAKAKAILLSSFKTREIDSRYPQGFRPAKREQKDSGKNKSTNFTFVDTSSRKQSFSTQQTSSANSKKDQEH